MCVLEIFGAQKISIGSIETKVHDVRGDVYIVDETTLEIENFYYDGKQSDSSFPLVHIKMGYKQ